MKATAYILVVEPVAGAKPALTSLHTLESRLEKGLDDKCVLLRWAILQQGVEGGERGASVQGSDAGVYGITALGRGAAGRGGLQLVGVAQGCGGCTASSQSAL